LLLETSTHVALAAIARGSRVLKTRRLDETRRHARDLAPAVRDLLRSEEVNPRAVDAVIVGTGPGSYTGLRVGIMSAKTFAHVTGCRLIGVECFAALALQAPDEASTVDVFADAQQDRVYWQRFERCEQATQWRPTVPLQIRLFAEWCNSKDRAPWVTGPGLRGKEMRIPAGIRLVNPERWQIAAESLLQLGSARYQMGAGDDPLTLEPLYLRPSAAEQQWQGQRAGGSAPA
jgi:tRNA threonylcarbamoyladenosine biosynthesis protein TsaB